MIREFKFKNFHSFKDEQVLSFEATSEKTLSDYYCVEIKPGLRLLKMGIIYGANASGKTNVLKAFSFLYNVLTQPRKSKEEEITYYPFMFEKESKKGKSSFELVFYINTIKYVYQIELDKKRIYFEKLEFYPSVRPALIFERNYDKKRDVSEIKYGKKIDLNSNDKIILSGNTLNNTSVLAAFSISNIASDILGNIHKFLKYNIHGIIDNQVSLINLINNISQKLDKKEINKSFIINYLTQADLNINDIFFEEKAPHQKEIYFNHLVNGKEYQLPLKIESKGTIRYYGLSAIIEQLLLDERFVFIDELEESLHYDLILHFLKTFLQNSKNSQLLFTTQNISLLAEKDLLRKDIVWFTEKNDKGESQLFSLPEFNIRKEISYYNAYRSGKFGAKPNLGNFTLE